jgi:NAD+ diphosphatase
MKPSSQPLAAYLPFNRESLVGQFVPAKNGDPPEDRHGTWLLVQDNALLVCEAGVAPGWRLPQAPLPEALARTLGPIVHLGTYKDAPCWAAAVPQGVDVPTGFQWESLLPARTRLTDDALSLGGLALQAIHWELTSLHCPRCGSSTERMRGEWGKRCPGCNYEHYPHLHPAVIVLVRDGDRVLLTRKAFWPKGRYGLVAGFVDAGESLEGAAAREVREEVGVEIRDLRYAGSQHWPFPSQLMVGFTAEYACGDLRVNREELEDARWFSVHDLPDLPPKLSIARFLLDHFARSDEIPGGGT